MALDEKSEDGDPLKFLIKSNDPARDETRIVCQVSISSTFYVQLFRTKDLSAAFL